MHIRPSRQFDAREVVTVNCDENKGRGLYATRKLSNGQIVIRDIPLACCPELQEVAEDILVCDACRRFLGSIQLQLHLSAGDVDVFSLRETLCQAAKSIKKQDVVEVTSQIEQLLKEPSLPNLSGCSTQLSRIFVNENMRNLLFCSPECAASLTSLQAQFYGTLFEEPEDDNLKPIDKLTASIFDIEDSDDQRHIGLACALYLCSCGNSERLTQIKNFKSEVYWALSQDEDIESERKSLLMQIHKDLTQVLGDAKSSISLKEFAELVGAVSLNSLGVKIPSPIVRYCIALQKEAKKNAGAEKIILDFAKKIQSHRNSEAEGSEEKSMEIDQSDQIDEIVKFNWDEEGFDSSLFHHFEGSAMYPVLAMLNHSCKPNCSHMYLKSSEAVLFSTSAIGSNEELTISYIGEDWGSPEERQKELVNQYGFVCTCSKCKSNQ